MKTLEVTGFVVDYILAPVSGNTSEQHTHTKSYVTIGVSMQLGPLLGHTLRVYACS
jgi:hypothetical protein